MSTEALTFVRPLLSASSIDSRAILYSLSLEQDCSDKGQDKEQLLELILRDGSDVSCLFEAVPCFDMQLE